MKEISSLAKSSRNLPIKIITTLEHQKKVGKFKIQVVLVTDPIGSQGKVFKDAHFLARVVVRRSMQVQVSVGGFPKTPRQSDPSDFFWVA